jgi:transcriptional regulator with XRE-family HTH domain
VSSTAQKIRQVQLVGREIRRLRKERRLTQTELSSRIGIQQSDLSRMEKGEYRISLDTLFKLLAEFDVPIGEFFDDVTREMFSPREVRMVREFKSLGAEAQREVEAFIAGKQRPEVHDGDEQ